MTYYKKSTCGFTLIEIAIVLLVGGLLLASLSRMYTVYMKQYLHNVNDYRLQQTRNALALYQAGDGRLPCPADASLSPTDAGYGLEICPTGAGCPASIECVNGRDVDGDGTPERVLIGSVPHNTILALFENGPFADTARFPDFAAATILDAYRVKLRYAVTEEMTDIGYSFFNPAPNNIGAITITDEFNEQLTTPDDSAQFVIFSHGKNGVGGYSKNGSRDNQCIIPSGYTAGETGYVPGGNIPAGPNSSSIETDKENCDDNDAIFILGSRSLGDNSSYYDDHLYFINITSQELWKASLISNGMAWYNTNAGNVGLDVANDKPQAKLHVGDQSGSNEADMNALNTLSDWYCSNTDNTAFPDQADNPSSNCMNPSAIGGNLPKMTCPAHQAVVAIENNSVVCQTVISALPASGCPVGEYLVGISNLGNIRCAIPQDNHAKH